MNYCKVNIEIGKELSLVEVPNRDLQPFAKAELRVVAEQGAGLVDIGEGVEYVALAGCAVCGPVVAPKQGGYLVVHLIDGIVLAVGYVEDIVDGGFII